MNDFGEVTSARIMKGDSREVVFRHTTSLMYLFTPDIIEERDIEQVEEERDSPEFRPSRKAALNCRKKLLTLAARDDI